MLEDGSSSTLIGLRMLEVGSNKGAKMRITFQKILAVILVVLFLAPSAMAAGRPEGIKPAVKKATVTFKVKRVNEKWAMDDGARLTVSVFSPVPKKIGQKFPVVIFIHPWVTDKTMYDTLAAKYASRGYVGLTYTVRGWFKSEGQINSMDPDYEVKDLRRIITLVGRDRRFPVRKDAKGPVVGVTGYSMGGVHSYLIANRANPRPGDPCDPRVRAIAPMHGGLDMLTTNYPNGAAKLAWNALLLIGGYTGNITGVMLNLLSVIFDPNLNVWQKITGVTQSLMQFLRTPLNNVNPELLKMMEIGLQRRTEDVEQLRSYMKRRSAQWWCDEEMDGRVEHPITVPTLMVAGWKDDLFCPNQSLTALNSLIAAPKRVIMSNHGHLGDFNFPWKFGFKTTPEQEWIEGQIQAWFDHFLKGVKNGAERGPAISYYREWNPTTYGTSNSWPLAGTTQVTYNVGEGDGGNRQGTLSTEANFSAQPDTLVNTGISGYISLPYFNDIFQSLGAGYMNIPEKLDLVDVPFQHYRYLSEPLTSDTIIDGTPRIKLTYKSSSEYTQLTPRVYEITAEGKKILISRGYYEGYDTRTGTRLSTGEKPIEMTACCYKVKAGSRLRLDIDAADLLTTLPVMQLSLIDLFHDAPGASLLILPMAPG